MIEQLCAVFQSLFVCQAFPPALWSEVRKADVRISVSNKGPLWDTVSLVGAFDGRDKTAAHLWRVICDIFWAYMPSMENMETNEYFCRIIFV